MTFKEAQWILCKLFRANFDYVESVTYLPECELKQLFNKATITYEHVMGLKKSFYVIYTGENSV